MCIDGSTSNKLFNFAVREAIIDGVKQPAVDGRELHKSLGIKTRFDKWICRRIEEHSFNYEKDFYIWFGVSTGGRPPEEYMISFDMANL